MYQDKNSPEWQKYYAAKKAWEEKMLAKKPKETDAKALANWGAVFFMDGPNPPKYDYANNH